MKTLANGVIHTMTISVLEMLIGMCLFCNKTKYANAASERERKREREREREREG